MSVWFVLVFQCDLFWSFRANTGTSHYPPVWLLRFPKPIFRLLTVACLWIHQIKSKRSLLFRFYFSISSFVSQVRWAVSHSQVATEAGAREEAVGGLVVQGRAGVRLSRHKQPPEKNTDICRRNGQTGHRGCQQWQRSNGKIRYIWLFFFFFLFREKAKVWRFCRSLQCLNSLQQRTDRATGTSRKTTVPLNNPDDRKILVELYWHLDYSYNTLNYVTN